MFTVYYEGRKRGAVRLRESPNLIVVRTQERAPLHDAVLSPDARSVLDGCRCVARFPSAGVSVLRIASGRGVRKLRDAARRVLDREPAVEFAGRGLTGGVARSPVVYTENIFVKFCETARPRACRRTLRQYGLRVKREPGYAVNAFLAAAPRGAGRRVFSIAAELLRDESVELCQPELIRRVGRRRAFPQQWHLKKTVIGGRVIDAHASVEEAWKRSRGEGVVIAVIDDGFDVDHDEFSSPGKIIRPRDVTLRNADPRPGALDRHGTACAGVACADGRHGASGVAPAARLMPIRLASGLGSMDEAEALYWAAREGADVISCSWGPEDGAWWRPDDPLHRQKSQLPDATRLAIRWAVEHGRGGKGCVVVFAAGNGNESVDRDGYAACDDVIAVAACDDAGRRSVYSDYGRAVWCAFPSSSGGPSRTTGIWTTDRTGRAGYNPGDPLLGDRAGKYTSRFGGTSSTAPGVAGVAALMLAVAPGLSCGEVKDLLRRSCDRIDARRGGYGKDGHSPLYGHGRVNAGRAVQLAAEHP